MWRIGGILRDGNIQTDASNPQCRPRNGWRLVSCERLKLSIADTLKKEISLPPVTPRGDNLLDERYVIAGVFVQQSGEVEVD